MNENDQLLLTRLEEEVFDVAEQYIWVVSESQAGSEHDKPILFAGPSGRNRIPFW